MTASREALQSYITALKDLQQQRVRDALNMIPNEHRRLLALRGYTRFPDRVRNRWAWTNEESEQFSNSRQGVAMATEIRQIRNVFARSYAGYTLGANQRARSLERQLALWNQNDTTEALGRELWRLALAELGGDDYPETPTADSTILFSDWVSQNPARLGLRTFVQRTVNGRRVRVRISTPSNATPGLSSHGQVKAIDFIIRRSTGVVVAGANLATADTVWRGNPNWQNRLRDVINGIGNNWDGPLINPDEPWHYEYTVSEDD